MLHQLITTLEHYGVLGVFIISFIGNVIPYSAIPYPAFIIACAATVEGISKLYIALAGGIGASFGKFVLYFISRYASKPLSEKRRKQLEYFKTIFSKKKADYITIFLFAALPLPDDVLYIPLGVAKYEFFKFASMVLLGKIFLSTFSVFLGSQARWIIGESIKSGYLVLGMIALIIGTIIMLLIILFADWSRIIKVVSEEGFMRGFMVFLSETKLILTFKHPNLRKNKKSSKSGFGSKN